MKSKIKKFSFWFFNTIWMLLCKKKALHFIKAAKDVEKTQKELLLKILEKNKKTAFGLKYEFSSISTIDEYKSKVPVMYYDDYAPFIDLILKGSQNILTSEPVILLEPSSGSTAPSKHIPYTNRLKKDFDNAVSPWIYDMFSKRKRLIYGASYWSISPINKKNETASTIPVGFNADSEYFGKLERLLLNFLLIVPSEISQIEDITTFRYVTLLFLIKEKTLTFISIWHPTFLILLLEPLINWMPDIIKDLKDGKITTPGEINASLKVKLEKKLSKNTLRAKEIKKIYENSKGDLTILLQKLWPNLTLISTWADGNASLYINDLKRLFPSVEIQPKGLLATEGVVSFPIIGEEGALLAITSHFFEFIPINNPSETKLAHELEKGGLYKVVITTNGGLYRYGLQDIIEVTGFVEKCPLIKFIGKENNISDFFGEKLNEFHVSSILDFVLNKHNIKPSFYMFAPEKSDDGAFFYTLFLQFKELFDYKAVCEEIEDKLMENFHYKYSRNLNQIQKIKFFEISPDSNPKEDYINHCLKNGKRLGNIKIPILETKLCFSRVFSGVFIDN